MQHPSRDTDSSGCSEFLLMNHKTFICIENAQSLARKELTWICVTEHTYAKHKLISCGYPFIKSGGGRLRSMLMGVGIRVLITSADC